MNNYLSMEIQSLGHRLESLGSIGKTFPDAYCRTSGYGRARKKRTSIRGCWMIGDEDRPLTTQALNIFFESFSKELDKVGIKKDTKHGLFHDLATRTLPIEYDDEFEFVVDTRTKLPETIGMLRKMSACLTDGFLQEETSEELAKMQIQQAWELAVRAAERVLPPKRGGPSR